MTLPLRIPSFLRSVFVVFGTAELNDTFLPKMIHFMTIEQNRKREVYIGYLPRIACGFLLSLAAIPLKCIQFLLLSVKSYYLLKYTGIFVPIFGTRIIILNIGLPYPYIIILFLDKYLSLIFGITELRISYIRTKLHKSGFKYDCCCQILPPWNQAKFPVYEVQMWSTIRGICLFLDILVKFMFIYVYYQRFITFDL